MSSAQPGRAVLPPPAPPAPDHPVIRHAREVITAASLQPSSHAVRLNAAALAIAVDCYELTWRRELPPDAGFPGLILDDIAAQTAFLQGILGWPA